MNNLDLPMVGTNQNQKEVTINDQAVALDAAFSEVVAVDLSAGDVMLRKEDFTRNFLFQCSGNSVARTVTVYAGVKRLFAIENQGSASLTITAGSAAVTVPAGNVAILHCDGTDVRAASSGASSGIASVAPGGGISVDATDPANPAISADVQDAPAGPHVRDEGNWTKLVAGSNVTFDGSTPGQIAVSASSGGSASFPDMTGNKGKVLAVNGTEDGVEWVDGGSSSLAKGFDVPIIGTVLDTGTGNCIVTMYMVTDDVVINKIKFLAQPTSTTNYNFYLVRFDASKKVDAILDSITSYSVAAGDAAVREWTLAAPITMIAGTVYGVAAYRAGGTRFRQAKSYPFSEIGRFPYDNMGMLNGPFATTFTSGWTNSAVATGLSFTLIDAQFYSFGFDWDPA